MNGGTCSVVAAADGDRFHCRCSPGFTGDRCRDDVDDCATRPCANGATCVDRANSFVCLCANGFTGRDCSAKIDECQSRPCRRGTCLDLMNGYRCLCDGGFTGTNCEAQTFGGGGIETTGDSATTASFDDISPETDVPPTMDSYLRQVMLVVCLGLLLMLLIICLAVVVFVLQHRRRRRSRRRRGPSGDSKQKMNNAAEDHGDGGCGGYYDEKQQQEKSKGGAGHLDVLKSQQQQQQQHLDHHQQQQHHQHRSEFAVRGQVQVQRNINDATNLKNVEKCSNRKQKVLDWNAGLESNATRSPDRNGGPESKTNIDQTKETNVWKQR